MAEALGDKSWTTALQEELNQFTRNDVWYLVPKPNDKHVIGTKWISRTNKMKMRSL